jgi:hypothetical protein
MNNFKGNKYTETQNLDIKEIAKLVRADLKQFKDCKFSVSIERYSMGQSLNVYIMQTPFDVYEYIEEERKYTLRANNLVTEVKNILNQYNYDNSDSMTDYFDTRFYSDIRFGKWNKAWTRL